MGRHRTYPEEISVHEFGGDTYLYSWLTADEFKFLSSGEGEAMLTQWLSEIKVENNQPLKLGKTRSNISIGEMPMKGTVSDRASDRFMDFDDSHDRSYEEDASHE